MPDWVNEGFQEYSKRLSKYCKFKLIELPLATRSKNTSIEQVKNIESEALLSRIKTEEHVIALDLSGARYSTEQFAEYISKLSLVTSNISLLIGGPDGMNAECLVRANSKISLSTLTLPHPLVRIIIAEQLYRALSFLENHPYHK